MIRIIRSMTLAAVIVFAVGPMTARQAHAAAWYKNGIGMCSIPCIFGCECIDV